MDKQRVIENLNALFEARAKFYEFFDNKIPKISNTDVFDFKKAEKVDLKEVYEHFHLFDYKIRKLLPSLYKAYELKDEDLKRDF